MSLDRLITTQMSAKIINDLARRGWSIDRIAEVIDAPADFVHGVKARMHVLTFRDLKMLARELGSTPYLMILESLDVKPKYKPLLDSTRRLLQLSALQISENRSRSTKKRRIRKRAA